MPKKQCHQLLSTIFAFFLTSSRSWKTCVWTRLSPAHLYGLWLPVHTTAFSVHLPSISDEPEPDGNADADDEDAEVDAEALTKKRSHLPFGKCCYACAALKLACQNFRKPSSSCLPTCFSNHAILWAQCELSFLLDPKETIMSQHPWVLNCSVTCGTLPKDKELSFELLLVMQELFIPEHWSET